MSLILTKVVVSFSVLSKCFLIFNYSVFLAGRQLFEQDASMENSDAAFLESKFFLFYNKIIIMSSKAKLCCQEAELELRFSLSFFG